MNQKKLKEFDYIVILGAKVNKDCTPTKLLRTRLDKAILLYNINSNKIIVSGGKGLDEPISEALCMQKYLIHNGVNSSDIYLESKSTSTYKNLKYVKKKFLLKDQKVLILTNKFHVNRVNMLGNKLKLNFTIVAIDSPRNIKTEIRESFAYIKSFFIDRF